MQSAANADKEDLPDIHIKYKYKIKQIVWKKKSPFQRLKQMYFPS
jgi:hypothetical protein